MSEPGKPGLWPALRTVAKSLSFFAENRKYTYIDRIGDAQSPEAAVKALKDALRDLRAASASQPGITIPPQEDIEVVIKAFYKDISYASILAALSLGTAGRGEHGKKGGEK